MTVIKVAQWQMNSYYPVFCGERCFQTTPPCHSTELVKFRQRVGEAAEESTVIVDTTVQEKAIRYPTDSKLAIKIINRLNKLAKRHGIQQRRRYVKEVKGLRLACRHFRPVKKRSNACKALKRLRTIAGALLCELQSTLPAPTLPQAAERFAL